MGAGDDVTSTLTSTSVLETKKKVRGGFEDSETTTHKGRHIISVGCEPSLPRLRLDVVIDRVDGTSGSTIGVNDHAIQMDDFAIELLNAPSIKRGFQALKYFSL